jgi:hypothetical protein
MHTIELRPFVCNQIAWEVRMNIDLRVLALIALGGSASASCGYQPHGFDHQHER